MLHLRLILIILFFFSSTSCQKNPATGLDEFSLISPSEEDSIGKNEHKKIINQYGIYKDKSLQSYVNSLGNFLVSTSELSNKVFTFTILDTPIVNAFALPGGYIYLTRGLLALCNNEAQLAGVIAHEIGHITARHGARRYTKTVSTNLILNVLGSMTRNRLAQNLLSQSSGLYLLSYSRSQEYEADSLAIRYMKRAGFDTIQMASFLQSMENYSKVKSKLLDIKRRNSELLQTHPNSAKRVREVIKETKSDSQINPILGRDIFLKKIDGLKFGHNEKEGFFMKERFVHPKLEITFPLLDNYFFINTPERVIGVNKNKSQLTFDIDEFKGQSTEEYLKKWAKKSKLNLSEIQIYNINSLGLVTGTSQKNEKQLLFGIIKGPESKLVYRFILATNKEELPMVKSKFINLVKNFRKIFPNEFKAPEIKIVSVKDEKNFLKNVISSQNLQIEEAELIFRAINETEIDKVTAGQKIKVIY